MPRIQDAGPIQGQAGPVPMDTGLAPEGSGVCMPLPSQLELSRQVLTAVLGEDAGHAVQAAVPCLLMLVLQKEGQHGQVSDHFNRTWGGKGRNRILGGELLDLWCCDSNTCGMDCGIPAPLRVL